MTAAALLLVALMANQHRVGRAVAKKTLVRSIKCAFPGWLMDIVLLLQSENVQVALQKSQEHVPPVLRRDLDILVGQLEMEPESVLPYHRFLKSFQIPEVHSAMSMLFSVSMGNSGRADRQIGELIDRNAGGKVCHRKNYSLFDSLCYLVCNAYHPCWGDLVS